MLVPSNEAKKSKQSLPIEMKNQLQGIIINSRLIQSRYLHESSVLSRSHQCFDFSSSFGVKLNHFYCSHGKVPELPNISDRLENQMLGSQKFQRI